VEGVVAAAEVKSLLTTTELDDAMVKADSFKTLGKWSSDGDMTFGPKNPDEDRFYLHPPFFTIALDCNVLSQTIVDRLSAADLDRGDGPIGLDAVFILGRGVALHLGDGTDNLLVQLSDGTVATGWVWTDSDFVVSDLLVWLAASTRRTIRFTVPIAPSLDEYMKGRTFQIPGRDPLLTK
jgi:hypothetical protein